MTHTTIEVLGTVFFALAVLHTFCVGKIMAYAHHFPKGSVKSSVLHLFGEIEVVFGLWAGLFMLLFVALEGWTAAIAYQNSLNFIEPFFIVAIMVVCSTRPVMHAARELMMAISLLLQKALRTPAQATDMFVLLSLGSLSGSFITEPAAMTVVALMLNSMLDKTSTKMIYGLLAVLFVNVSIGGALTPFAAPPILMVAAKWGWDLNYVFTHLGWKSAIAVVANSFLFVAFFRREIGSATLSLKEVSVRMAAGQSPMPLAVIFVHLLFLIGIVVTSHHQNAFLGLFLMFLGVATATQRYQDRLRLKEALLVSLFLGGIIQFGAFQKWWLAPLLASLSDAMLFNGAVLLTAVTDNAALTYLGSQVEGLSATSQYALVAGAIAGGGLTVIANAPNAAGYSILSSQFPDGIRPLSLLTAAVIPTLIAVGCLWFL
jgi:Na+/H+ antiporter NhaD/arsenite permease-like protein